MTLRQKVVASVAVLAALTLAGCTGEGDDAHIVTKAQATSFANNNNAGIAALRAQGYTPVAVAAEDGQPYLFLRKCSDSSTLENCLVDMKLGKHTPDVYLDIKDMSSDKLHPTGPYVLMYGPSRNSHPKNGLRCVSDPADAKLDGAAIKSFKALGEKAYGLDYKTNDAAAADRIHTIQADGLWWKCHVTVGQLR